MITPPIKVRHPNSGLLVTFDPEWQTFKFNNSKRLTSVNKILGKIFPFDADKVAAKLARSQGRSAEEVKAEWSKSIILSRNVTNHFKDGFLKTKKEKKVMIAGKELNASTNNNKNNNNNNNNSSSSNQAQSSSLSTTAGRSKQEVTELHGDEEQYYRVASKAVELLSQKYEVIEEDVIICSPDLLLGGKVDFLCRNKETGNVVVMDFSVTASTLSGFRFGTFDQPVVSSSQSSSSFSSLLDHLPNTRAAKFSLEVLLYGMMLKEEGYSKYFGKEIDQEDGLEYGVVQIGKSDSYIDAVVDFMKVDEKDFLLPRDGVGEMSSRDLLKRSVMAWN